jgi:NAD(P)-dependent dehydrogenase (short-subunit alcohol dehydrogenase family)
MPRPGEFAGRVAVVTGGAGAGTGSATAHRLAELGASVVVLDSHEGRALDVAAAVRTAHGVDAEACCVDLADRDAIDRAVRELPPVDILVNNAAINVQGSIFDYEIEAWDRVLAVDLTACFLLVRSLLSGMRDRGWGRIVNVSSVAAYLGGNGREAPYSVAKAGLNELTRAVAIEGGPHGIRCNAVAPGLVESKWVEAQRERYQPFIEATPLRRNAEPLDVANAIAFLCSDESAHITGQVLNISGGWYLTP